MKQVLCFGEVLFDGLPSGPVVGGAPLNVALHLHQWGVPVKMASSIGADAPGEMLLQFLSSRNFPIDGLVIDEARPTGWVDVAVDAQGQPSYTICAPSAWDAIPFDPKLAASSSVVVFGSLAMRHAKSRESVSRYFEEISYRIFDINLRPPFVEWTIIESFMQNVEVLKLNRNELGEYLMHKGLESVQSDNQDLYQFAKLFPKVQHILITDGEHGAYAFSDHTLWHHPIKPCDIVDTVGCGDAFLAGFLWGQAQNCHIEKALRYATAAASAVAASNGATPKVSIEQLYASL